MMLEEPHIELRDQRLEAIAGHLGLVRADGGATIFRSTSHPPRGASAPEGLAIRAGR
jgi:hypothetical protein